MLKKFISFVIINCFLISVCFSECDWKKIVPQGDSFLYPKECHLKVEQLLDDVKIREEQIAKLNKALDLKDLVIAKAEERTELWRGTAYKMEDRLIAQEKWSSKSGWVYFGLGVITTVAAGFAISYAAKLR